MQVCSLLSLATAVPPHVIAQQDAKALARQSFGRKALFDRLSGVFDNAGIVPGDCEDLFNLAANAPKTRFIFAHMGGANFRFWNILVLARTADGFALDNVNFDISGTVLLAADSPIEKEFVWTLRNVGIDHVMLGSDYPQISLARMVEALEKLDLTSEEKTAILSGNARRILGATSVGRKSN